MFYLQSNQFTGTVIKAALSDRASAWMHGYDNHQKYPVSLDAVGFDEASYRLAVKGDVAERMYAALGAGRVPTFSYTRADTAVIKHQTDVAVSSVHFLPAYEKFNACKEQLLPFGLDAIQDRVFYFDRNSENIDSISNRFFFGRIGRYLKAIGGGTVVVTSEAAATEKAFGTKRFDNRFKGVKALLIKAGVPEQSIKKRHSYSQASGRNERSVRIGLFGPESLRTFYYSSKKSGLTSARRTALNLWSRYLSEYQKSGRIIIHSHTNDVGSRRSNKLLSTRWAEQIKYYLTTRGISAERITIRSYGESKHAFSNRSSAGRRKNQRVIIDLVT